MVAVTGSALTQSIGPPRKGEYSATRAFKCLAESPVALIVATQVHSEWNIDSTDKIH